MVIRGPASVNKPNEMAVTRVHVNSFIALKLVDK